MRNDCRALFKLGSNWSKKVPSTCVITISMMHKPFMKSM